MCLLHCSGQASQTHVHALWPAGDEQQEGSGRLNEQIGELGKQAGVLSKQAASNLKKGFASLASSAKEMTAKAHDHIKRGGSGQA